MPEILEVVFQTPHQGESYRVEREADGTIWARHPTWGSEYDRPCKTQDAAARDLRGFITEQIKY